MSILFKHALLTTIIFFTARGLFAQELFIKPARTISFTTNEGTDMDVDISPDGKTIAFCLLGDLYTVPATGGKATQITRGIAINTGPRWSPDGTKIAYWGDTSGTIHVNVIDLKRTFHAVLGKEETQIKTARDSNFVWTPDGSSIVIGSNAYSLQGQKSVVDSNSRRVIGFSQNAQIIYSAEVGEFEGTKYPMSIYWYNIGLKKYKLMSSTIQSGYSGILSQNGRWWCCYADSNRVRCLMLTDLLKNEKRMLASNLLVQNPRYSQSPPFPHISFTADSKNVFIGYAGKIHRIELESGDDRIIPFSADVKADLGPLNYNAYKVSDDPEQIKYIRSVNTSPDKRHLVFSALGKIYVMDLPNGKPRLLVDQPMNQFQPAYSPNGNWIAYVSWTDNAEGQLWRVPAVGGAPEQLTRIASEYRYPAWSPDGSKIAIAQVTSNFHNPGYYHNYNDARIELVSIPDKAVKTIVDSVPTLNQLVFSADGRRIIYQPASRFYEWVLPQLVSKEIDGDGKAVIAIGAGIGHPLPQNQQVVFSPDGRYMVYSAAEDLFLVPTPKSDNPVVLLHENHGHLPIRFAAGIDPFWEDGGKTLAWSFGNRFYRIDPDRVVAAAKKIRDTLSPKLTKWESHFVSIQLTPDETIKIPLSTPLLYAHGTIALTNARIITMQGEKVIEKGTILIKDRRIMAVGPSSTVVIPKGTATIDLAGATIMPGLIDLHFHFGSPAPIIPQQFWSLQAALAYGATTIRDPAQLLTSYGIAELLNGGIMRGPRLFTVGEALFFSENILLSDNPDDFQRVVQKRAVMGSIVVKNYLRRATRLQRQWVQAACQAAGLNMTNEGEPNLIDDLGMIKDGDTGVEHNPEWGDVYKDVVTFFAHSGTWLTPTLQVRSVDGEGNGILYFNYQYWRKPDEKQRHFSFSGLNMRPGNGSTESIEVITQDEQLPPEGHNASFFNSSRVDAQIRHLGGRVGLGSHGNGGGTGPHSELWALQAGGLTNIEALQAGTIMGAEGLGLQKDLGSLEVGKIADLIILNKNPLEDIHNSREIRYVMKDGILYDGNNLDEIWPEKKKCPDWRQPIDMQVTPPPPPSSELK